LKRILNGENTCLIVEKVNQTQSYKTGFRRYCRADI